MQQEEDLDMVAIIRITSRGMSRGMVAIMVIMERI
jgi:hypothetical protein